MDRPSVSKALPDRLYVKPHTEVDYYGARFSIVRDRLAVSSKKCYCTWKHGWYFYRELVDPVLIVNTDEHCFYHLVHNDLQRKYLADNGYENVVAVGMPYLYVKAHDVKRIPNSVLVMPHHSLMYSGTKSLNGNQLIHYMLDLKKNFDHVGICLHSSCYEKYADVVGVLAKNDVECISGADHKDMNSLLRMHVIFSSYEYVTTSSMGSHVAYSAFSGCKTSLSEDLYYQPGYDDFKNDPFYLANPQVLDYVVESLRLSTIKKQFPFLFSDPEAARERIAWGEEQLGAAHKRPEDEMMGLLNVGGMDQILAPLCSFKKAISSEKILRRKFRIINWKVRNMKMLLKNKLNRR